MAEVWKIGRMEGGKAFLPLQSSYLPIFSFRKEIGV